MGGPQNTGGVSGPIPRSETYLEILNEHGRLCRAVEPWDYAGDNELA